MNKNIFYILHSTLVKILRIKLPVEMKIFLVLYTLQNETCWQIVSTFLPDN